MLGHGWFGANSSWDSQPSRKHPLYIRRPLHVGGRWTAKCLTKHAFVRLYVCVGQSPKKLGTDLQRVLNNEKTGQILHVSAKTRSGRKRVSDTCDPRFFEVGKSISSTLLTPGQLFGIHPFSSIVLETDSHQHRRPWAHKTSVCCALSPCVQSRSVHLKRKQRTSMGPESSTQVNSKAGLPSALMKSIIRRITTDTANRTSTWSLAHETTLISWQLLGPLMGSPTASCWSPETRGSPTSRLQGQAALWQRQPNRLSILECQCWTAQALSAGLLAIRTFSFVSKEEFNRGLMAYSTRHPSVTKKKQYELLCT